MLNTVFATRPFATTKRIEIAAAKIDVEIKIQRQLYGPVIAPTAGK